MLTITIVVNSVGLQCNLILISIDSDVAEITLLLFSYSVKNENRGPTCINKLFIMN